MSLRRCALGSLRDRPRETIEDNGVRGAERVSVDQARRAGGMEIRGHLDARASLRLRLQFELEGRRARHLHLREQRQSPAGLRPDDAPEFRAWKSETVKRYAHFAPEQLRTAANRLGTFLGTLGAAANAEARTTS